MRLELVSFAATDKVMLPGLLYRPTPATKKVAVWLHGMGDNGIFYNPERANTLAEQLAKNNIALLAFNNRGAHSNKRLKLNDETLPEEDRYYQGGTHYELIGKATHDIEGAVDFLEQAGFSELFLLGHSTGANKVCVYHARRRTKSRFAKYVLAGPGDDIGMFFESLGPERFWRALKYAAAAIESDPFKVMPKYTGMYPFSAQSAWDILNPDGAYNTFPYYESRLERLGSKPLFEEYRQIDRPTLVVIGAEDEYMQPAGDADEALKLLMAQTSNSQLKQSDFVSIAGADHSFHGHEQEFARTVSDWLAHD